MYPVWIILTDDRILLGWISCSVLQEIDGRGVQGGEELNLVVDERHRIAPESIIPVRDLWIPLNEVYLSSN